MKGMRGGAVWLLAGLGSIVGPRWGAAQVSVLGQAEIGRVEHRVRVAGVMEPASGTLLGAGVGVVVGGRWEIWGATRGGRLVSATGGDDRDFAEVDLLGGRHLRPWLTVQAGATVRTYSTSLARQRWSTLRLGAEARVPLALEQVRGIVRGQWMPITSVSGLPHPSVALAAGAGVEWQGRRWSVSALYALERYDFPGSGGTQRLEELSSLRVRGSVRVRS